MINFENTPHKGYGGCHCICHKSSGVYHCVPCCYPDSEFLFSNPDLLDFERLMAEAEAAGEHTCECGFTYFKTVDRCPLCDKVRPS